MQQATIFCPADSYYSFRLGLLYIHGGFLDDAIAALSRAIDLKPEERIYHAVIAEAYREQGNPRGAETHRRFAGEMDYYDLANLAVVRKQARA